MSTVMRRNRQGHPSTRRRPPAPDHLLVWLTGVAASSDDPVPRPAEPSDLSGRGLLVVDALSPSWGVLLGRDVKSVWAWIPLTEGDDRGEALAH